MPDDTLEDVLSFSFRPGLGAARPVTLGSAATADPQEVPNVKLPMNLKSALFSSKKPPMNPLAYAIRTSTPRKGNTCEKGGISKGAC